ncbi:MAG TPA: hypothetical protein GXX42_14785 [Petrimonas sp.]|uniref:hypothetical protein n=1 Tax=Petrimonas sp. TaxID=2023866 RepID=UPI00175BBCF1|nr:hypothetical protein [Petrimonas sp.]
MNRRKRLIFDEAVNLFYTDDGIDRQTINNMIAEDIFKAVKWFYSLPRALPS